METSSQTEPKQRRQRSGPYTAEFKRDSVAAFRASGQSVPSYAPQIGIHETTLYAWIREVDSPLTPPMGGVAQNPATIEVLQTQLRALRSELERTRIQRDILKKTLGIVCEPPTSATSASRP